MLEKLFKIPALHTYLHFFGALVLIVGLPLSKVLMSIGAIWLVANLVLEGQFKTYSYRLRREPLFWLLTALFFLHIVGLFWSADLSYGWQDIKTKLPLLTIPLALFAKPIKPIYLTYLWWGFLTSLLITSVINVLNYYVWSDTWITGDSRELSLFGSHIRYGLLVNFGIVLSVYLPYKKKINRWVGLLLMFWLLTYTVLAQVLSGYIVLIILLILAVFFLLHRITNTLIRWSGQALFSVLILTAIYTAINLIQPTTAPIDVESLPQTTAAGNRYLHLTGHELTENGHHVLLYICEDELRPAWNAVSELPYDDQNPRGESVRSTLFKYMTSKGLTKDAAGLQSMTAQDIQNVERGISTIREKDKFYFRRIEGLRTQLYNYRMGESPSGSTILQRFEHWRAGIYIVKENWLFGVGTGDIQAAFDRQYEVMNTSLKPAHWNRTHNQFLTFWITFGVFGFTLFVVLWWYIVRKAWSNQHVLLMAFSVIAISSCLLEDTLETQQGVTFIAFFMALLWPRTSSTSSH